MKITKYEHACLVLEEQGKQLVIDPGELSNSFVVPENPVALVITHIHGDHFDKTKIKAIVSKNPAIKIFTIEDVAKELFDLENITTVSDKQEEDAYPFSLIFYGTNHAIVHENAPRFKNTGVLVNNLFYYPGDSFTLPETPVQVLAVPTSGPWLKASESIDFMLNIKPKLAFATHDALLSENGAMFTNNWLTSFATQNSIEFQSIKLGQSFEV